MILSDTIGMMTSPYYKDRFRAEYYQLEIRLEGLKRILDGWNNLAFEPLCSFEILNSQYKTMQEYLGILKVRAEIEDIEL